MGMRSTYGDEERKSTDARVFLCKEERNATQIGRVFPFSVEAEANAHGTRGNNKFIMKYSCMLSWLISYILQLAGAKQQHRKKVTHSGREAKWRMEDEREARKTKAKMMAKMAIT